MKIDFPVSYGSKKVTSLVGQKDSLPYGLTKI